MDDNVIVVQFDEPSKAYQALSELNRVSGRARWSPRPSPAASSPAFSCCSTSSSGVDVPQPTTSQQALLSAPSTVRGHKTDTSETTRATPRDASRPPAAARFAGERVPRVIAHGKEGVDGSSPSEGFVFLPA